MAGQMKVQFTVPSNGVPSLPSPVHSFNFVFDLANSDDGSSEKEKDDLTSPISPKEERDEQPSWNQRPKSMPWSSRPLPLREKLKLRWWRDIVADSFSILMPLPFLLLGAVLIFVNGKIVNEADLSFIVLDQAIKGTATIFPIFFAALTGRAAVKFATWKLEQGSTIGLLEQLMNSRTVASTITTQIHLRTFNLVGLGLVVLWALSPIGSQAALQLLTTPFIPSPSPTHITYFNTRQQSYATPDGPFKGNWFSGFGMLFGASLIAPTDIKTSSLDLWGNVRIPYYSSTLNSSSEVDSDGWTHIPDGFPSVYSSLFGLPVSDIPIGNITFTVETSYMKLDCKNLTQTQSNHSGIIVLGQSIDPNTVHKSTLITTNGPYLSNANVSVLAAWAIGYSGGDVAAYNETLYGNTPYTYPEACPDCLATNISSTTYEAGTLLYQEFDGNDNATNIFCTPTEVYIESAIACEKTDASRDCHVTAQRPSQLPHMPSTITSLSFHNIVLGITALLPNATLQPGGSDPVQSYLYSPLSAVGLVKGDSSLNFDGLVTQTNGIPGDGSSPLASGAVSLQDFSDRFGQVLNSFLFSSLWNATTFISGSPLSGITPSQLGGNAASFVPVSEPDDIYALIRNQTAAFTVTGMLTTQIQVYRVSYPWLVVFFMCSVAMMGSAIAGVGFSRSTNVPDYLGYVSSLAKESPYVRMPGGGANLDGMERARLMKGLKVRLGDVEGGRSGVGRLAFARMEETAGVKSDGFYV